MNKLCLFAISVATAIQAGGCAALIGDVRLAESQPLASHDQAIATEVVDCRDNLDSGAQRTGPELESGHIRLVSWNVKKGQRLRWQEDLESLSADSDLVLIQEAALPADAQSTLTGIDHWTFAPGYRNDAHLTGVMTYSNSESLIQCNLTSWEPWLGTPKATGITQYGLTGTDESLIVINVHAINFTFGVAAFQEQLEQIRPILAAHEGPIILSGDFNTWRKKRFAILDGLARDFSLQPLEFDEDHRKTFFGQRLDHIYVRGLKIALTGTQQVETSDHNPLFAEFTL